MKFRYARHTNNLSQITEFYLTIVGLEKLGGFANHDGYDGVFLGFADKDWHLEFTQSEEKVDHHPDKDDLLVFYLDSEVDLQTILDKAEQANILPVVSQNPYWRVNARELTDPDGFGVILTVAKPD